MNAETLSPSLQSAAPTASGHARWRVASLIWIVSGFLFPLLTPATVTIAAHLQCFLISAAGFSDELLAFRVAVTLIRLPLTALFGILVAMAQCAIVPVVRPLARRWLIASAVGAAVSTLILLPSSLLLLQIVGSSSPEMIRIFLALLGAALFGGLVSFLQQRTARGRLWVPARFVVATVLEVMAGAFVELFLTWSVLGSLR